MKANFLFTMLFSALLFIGCSTENEEDFLIESSSAKLSKDISSAKMVKRHFKMKAYGDWFLVVAESTECNGLPQYSIQGQGNATHMGAITVEGKICAGPPELYFISGKYTSANGDELTWESTEVFFDENGIYAGGVFQFVEGNGRFSNVEGTFTVNEALIIAEIDEQTGFPLGGTWSNNGSGTITY